MKAAFLTLGCKLNYAETSTYQRGLVQAGIEVVNWRSKADLYLVNTCSVTETADSKSRNLIRKVHRVNPEAFIAVTGCSAQLKRESIEAIEGVSRVFGSDEKHLVVPTCLQLLGGGSSEPASSMCLTPSADECKSCTGFTTDKGQTQTVFGAYSSGERTRSFLKVQDGCNNFCKYCTVPYARGRSRNIPICEAVRYSRQIASQGIAEIVLTGVNTGDFGQSTGESFIDLLKALDSVAGIERYRISSIEPNLLTEEIIDWIASGTKFQPHFHIPLQTGNDTLLKAMGRRYDTEFFRRRIEYIRSVMDRPGRPKVFVGIDVMVGLPGETEELFRQTCEFIREIHPAYIHVFPYSRRPGTPAASMPLQVSNEAKKVRVATLEALCGELYADFVEQNKGIATKVLFESKEKDGTMSGFTENYIRIIRPYDPDMVGRIIEVTI